MEHLTQSYEENVAILNRTLRVSENFDVIRKELKIGSDALSLYYIDGFVKDTVMQKLMMHFLSLKKLPRTAAQMMETAVPYVETDVTANVALMLQMVLSGATLMLGSTFGAEGILIDSRSYPARDTSEPEGDRVMRGARDGFVETLIFNTALIRRRIRDCSLTMHYQSIGEDSKTDVVLCYMADRADPKYVAQMKQRLSAIRTRSLTMGQQSLAECLVPTQWYNPFPKIRITERPDVATAQLMEGSVLILVDNSPGVMVLPSSIFDFMQETNDFYFPPLTGTYIRLVRYIVFFTTLIITPLWYLFIRHPELTPSFLEFVLPENTGRIPIIFQLFLVEFIVDALRLASINTPNMLSNSLSVVGGLILGDFAVSIGWLIPEVILYMAFVSIANFTQRSYELGYAFKFMRLILLVLTWFFNIWGFLAGVILVCALIASNKTLNGKHSYLYPLVPFNGKALARMLFRVKKND